MLLDCFVVEGMWWDGWLAANPNVTFHFTPSTASWLKQVELLFAIFQRKTLRNASFPSLDPLVAAIESFPRLATRTPPHSSGESERSGARSCRRYR